MNEDIQNLSYDELKNSLTNAVNTNDIEAVKSLFKHPLIQEDNKYQNFINVTYALACKEGSLELVELFLTSPEFKLNADINSGFGKPLLNAAENNHADVIKYIIFSENFDPNIAIHNDEPIYQSILKEYVDVVECFYSSPQVKEQFDIFSSSNSFLECACTFGQFNLVKLLMTSPYLKDDILEYNIKNALIAACNNKHYDIVQYLILDCLIEKTEEIEQYLKDKPNSIANNIFTNRELNETLNNKTPYNLNKKIKV